MATPFSAQDMLASSELQDHSQRLVAENVSEPALSAAVPERIVVLGLFAHADADLEAAWLVTADGSQPLALGSVPQAADAAGALGALAQRWPDAPVVCFVEGPGRALASLLARDSGVKTSDVLARWSRGATALLRLRHRSPHRTLLLDLADWQCASAAAQAHLDARLQAGAAASVIGNRAPSDPLFEWIGQTVASLQPDIAQLWNELQVSCELVSGNANAATEADLALQALAHCRRWVEERSAAEGQLRTAGERHNASLQELAQTREALAATAAARSSLEAASELDRLRLQQALEEVEALAALTRQQQAQLARREVAEQEALNQAAARESALQSALSERQSAAADTAATLDGTLSALRDAQRDHRDGQVQLKLQQEQLQLQQLRLQDLSQLQHAHRSIGGLPIVERALCSELTVLVAKNEPPHRELVVALRNVAGPAGILPELQVRLVEHQGHPGLALFATGGVQPLRQWHPNGNEAGVSFMLLIPHDDDGANRLAALGTADWRFILAMAQRLQAELAADVDPAHGRWRQTAARLYRALCQLPPVFRYNAVEAHAEAGHGADGAACLTLVEACFGREPLGPVQLRWRSNTAPNAGGTAGATLEWLRPPAAAAPLLAWPLEGDGAWSPALAIPVGTAFDAGVKRSWWTSLPAADRDLLLGLLQALPAVAAEPAVRQLAPWLSGDSVAELQHDVRRLLARHRLRQALRRTLRGRRHGSTEI